MLKNEKVVDDNTLFLLMALKHQNSIKIKGINSVYTLPFDTNYDETIANPSSDLPIEKIAENGIEWIIKTASATCNREQNEIFGEIITLSIEDKTDSSSFLDYYLNEFEQPSDYYFSEDEHRKLLYKFIKEQHPFVLEYKDKVFPYQLSTGEKRPLKYKMLEYIFYLMHKRIVEIQNDCNTFLFNNDIDGKRKKSIRLNFTETSFRELFKKEIEEGKQDKLTEQLANEPINSSGGIFKVYADYVQCSSPQKISTEIKGDKKKLLEYCLKNSSEPMTIKKYRKLFNTRKDKPNDKSIRKYFTYLNKDMRKFLKIEFDFLLNDGTSGEWEICIIKP